MSNLRILFVDDLPDTRDVFRLAFKMHGHTTRLASNGNEAVTAVREELFDAVIIDVEMPQMNGWDAVRHMRQMPHGEHVPIIMFTAYGSRDDYKHALEVGADALLQKPILPQDLLHRVGELVIERSGAAATPALPDQPLPAASASPAVLGV